MQSSADSSASSQGGAKPGLASLMRRAVNQARAEAAAQAASQDPAGIGLSSDVKEEPKAAPDGKKALAAMLRKAAQKMQQEEGALAADSGQMVDSQRAPVAPPTGKKALGAMLKRAAQKMQEKEAQPGSESLSMAALLDTTVQMTDSIQQPVTTQQQALHEEIQRLTAVFESERSGTGTLALDADNVHLSGLSHASSSDSARGLLPTSLDRRPIRHQSLGQRLGSILKGALSLQKQSGYMAIDGDEPLQHPEPPPGRRRALPRDASYLPEWLNQTLGLSSCSDGNLTPAAGDAFAALGDVNELVGIDDDNALPQWVDWSALKPEEEHSPATSVSRRPAPLDMSLIDTHNDPPPVNNPATPAATPKGQQLFDFWQQKSAAATLFADDSLGPALLSVHVRRGLSKTDSTSDPWSDQQESAPAEPVLDWASLGADGQDTRQTQTPGSHSAPGMRSRALTAESSQAGPDSSAEHRHQSSAVVGAVQPADTEAASMRPTDTQVGCVQPDTASAALIAELETASQLVHKQSLQQAELLEGLERALSQLSEHRLLIMNPEANQRSEDPLQGEQALHGYRLKMSSLLVYGQN